MNYYLMSEILFQFRSFLVKEKQVLSLLLRGVKLELDHLIDQYKIYSLADFE